MKFELFILSFATLLSLNVVRSFDTYRMLCLVNQYRAENGLSALGMSDELNTAAQQQSDYQAETNTMSHTGVNGCSPGDRIQDAGYTWNTCAENVAFGYGDEDSCMQSWIASPGHRANILNDQVTQFGSAMSLASDNTPYYTQDFAGGMGGSDNYPQCPGSSDGSSDSSSDGSSDGNSYDSGNTSSDGNSYGSNNDGSDNNTDDGDYIVWTWN